MGSRRVGKSWFCCLGTGRLRHVAGSNNPVLAEQATDVRTVKLRRRSFLFRWKQELTQAAPLFVAVEITDAIPPTEEHAS